MKILIIGGHGFLGLQLLGDLEKKIPSADIYISTSRVEVSNNKFILVDYENAQSVENLITNIKPDYIFHLASSCIRDPSDIGLKKGKLRDNYILIALKKVKSPLKLIFISSMAVFSMIDKKIKPNSWCPKSNYGHEKLYMLKKLLNLDRNNKNIDCKIIYPSSIYGRGQDGKMFLPRLLKNIEKNELMVAFGGNKKRDFIHVKDVSRELVDLVLGYKDITRQHIFIHSFVLYKMSEIAGLVCNICGLNFKEVIVFKDSSIDKERDLLEYQEIDPKFHQHSKLYSKISIYQGLKEMFISG